MEKITDYIDIKFSYNGDLGKLQHQTQANLQTIQMLLLNKIITREEYEKLGEDIVDYFQKTIESASKNIYYYIRWF